MNKDNKSNISVIGGPGKPHTSDDNSSTSPTGGTGGMGFSGGTGASGFGGGLGRDINSIMDEEESVDDFSRKVAGIGLYGSTGGEGQHGPLDKVPMNSSSLAAMGKLFSDKINKMDSIDAILQDFNTCQTKLELVLQKTNAVNALYAFMQGKRLLRSKALFIQDGNKDWQKWIPSKVQLEKRTRQKYMSLASVPMVETHLEYGVERLAEFGSFFNSKSKDEKDAMGSDPFKKYMDKFNVRMDTSYDERKKHVDGVLEVSKLERLGMEFPLDVMLSFLRVQDALTGDERKHLIKLYKQDPQKPVDLLNSIIAKELERKNLIAGTNPPPPEENSDASNAQGTPGSGAGDATAVTGPNIEKQVFTLCKSLESATTPEGIKLDNSIDRNVLMRLKSFIDQLLEMNQDTQSAQNAAA